MTSKHWCRDTALEQIESCSFTCEGGPLEMNVAFSWLKRALEIGPKYLPGQGVYLEVTAETGGAVLKKWVHYYVVGVHMDSGIEDRFWLYALSNDPPGPWHYGAVQHTRVKEGALRLDIPEPGDAS